MLPRSLVCCNNDWIIESVFGRCRAGHKSVSDYRVLWAVLQCQKQSETSLSCQNKTEKALGCGGGSGTGSFNSRIPSSPGGQASTDAGTLYSVLTGVGIWYIFTCGACFPLCAMCTTGGSGKYRWLINSRGDYQHQSTARRKHLSSQQLYWTEQFSKTMKLDR